MRGELGRFANEETRTLILFALRRFADFLQPKRKATPMTTIHKSSNTRFAIAGSRKDCGGRPLGNIAPSHRHLQRSGKSANLRRMFNCSKESEGKRITVSESTLPRSISELKVRDIAWLIAGMWLAYLFWSI